jgi:hypothetical protein
MAKQQETVRTYHLAWWAWFVGILLGIALVLISYLYTGGWTLGNPDRLPDAFSGCAPILFGIGCFLIIVMVYLRWSSYLRVSPNGLEYRWGPFFHVHCQWHEIDSIKPVDILGIPQTSLHLSNAERLGPSWTWQARDSMQQLLMQDRSLIISLTGFQGWPKGKLADDLRRYAPHAFEREGDM